MTARGPRTERRVARALHLVAAAMLGFAVYAPLEAVEPVRLALQVLVVPGATLTGLFLWQQARFRAALTGRGAHATSPRAARR